MILVLTLVLVLFQEETPGERLVAAAAAGNSETVRKILDELQNQVDREVRTVVRDGGQHAVSQLLISVLQKNAVLNTRRASWTPLMHAAAQGHHEIVEALLKAGADRSLMNLEGQTAASLANHAGYLEVGSFIEGWTK